MQAIATKLTKEVVLAVKSGQKIRLSFPVVVELYKLAGYQEQLAANVVLESNGVLLKKDTHSFYLTRQPNMPANGLSAVVAALPDAAFDNLPSAPLPVAKKPIKNWQQNQQRLPVVPDEIFYGR